MPFGLNLVSVIVGAILAMFVLPYALALVTSLLGRITGASQAAPSGA